MCRKNDEDSSEFPAGFSVVEYESEVGLLQAKRKGSEGLPRASCRRGRKEYHEGGKLLLLHSLTSGGH